MTPAVAAVAILPRHVRTLRLNLHLHHAGTAKRAALQDRSGDAAVNARLRIEDERLAARLGKRHRRKTETGDRRRADLEAAPLCCG